MAVRLNCDVGEGLNNEVLLMPYIHSCSIACGGHAGDTDTMKRAVELAIQYETDIGAHPSYPDKTNFGRESMNMDDEALVFSVREQVEALEKIIRQYDIPLHHIKAHGALYNDMAGNRDKAEVFLSAVENYKGRVRLYVPYGSEIAKSAVSRGFNIRYEAFADRNYNDDLSLVSRKSTNAIILKPEAIRQHILYMVKEQKVRTVTGSEKTIRADTFCLHGDHPHAAEVLRYLSEHTI